MSDDADDSRARIDTDAKAADAKAADAKAADAKAADAKAAANRPPAQISLTKNTPTVTPEETVQKSGSPISGLQKEGVTLAKLLLAMIAVAVVLVTVLVMVSEFREAPEVTQLQTLETQIQARKSAVPAGDPKLPELEKDLQGVVRQLTDAKQAGRTFWMQFSQMILLNLLLPVLTAILGYVFGTTSSRG